MRKPRAVVCDDDDMILDVMRRILEGMGYEVLTADTHYALYLNRLHCASRRPCARPPLPVVCNAALLYFSRGRSRCDRVLFHFPGLQREPLHFSDHRSRRGPEGHFYRAYAIVRHPMYASALLYLVGTPLALGSFWGLLPLAAMMPFLIWRLYDEESLLAIKLSGYTGYQKKVRHRLIPFIW